MFSRRRKNYAVLNRIKSKSKIGCLFIPFRPAWQVHRGALELNELIATTDCGRDGRTKQSVEICLRQKSQQGSTTSVCLFFFCAKLLKNVRVKKVVLSIMYEDHFPSIIPGLYSLLCVMYACPEDYSATTI